MLRLRFVALVSLAAFAACANYGDDKKEPASPADAGTKSSSSSSSGSTNVERDGGTGPFGEEEDLPCEGRTTNDVANIYVHPSGIDGIICGSRESPCKTVQAGIAAAYVTQKPKVLVGAGTYTEIVTLDGGLIVEGGWDVDGTTWTASCAANHSSLATIVAVDNTSLRVKKGASVLRFLTFKSKTAGAAPGESLYGLIATGPNVKVALDDTDFEVGPGGKGADGAPGTEVGEESCEGNDGADGPGGTPGGAGAAGTLSDVGFNATPAADGAIGTAGHRGTPSKKAPELATFDFCDAANSCTKTPGQALGGAGFAGCGGPGGFGGKGGIGGGSSIGILASDAMIVTYGGRITTGAGGEGGAGGLGTDGLGGKPGKAGPGSDYAETVGPCPATQCTNTPKTAAGGEAGGAGGHGGKGGQGGGGAGGWSIGFAKFANAAVLTSTTTVFTNGGAGKGGAPNGIAGNGQQQWP